MLPFTLLTIAERFNPIEDLQGPQHGRELGASNVATALLHRSLEAALISLQL